MAASVRIEGVEDLGNSKFVYGTIVPGTMASGGVAIAIADTAQYDITLERIAFLAATGAGYVSDWDIANQKLKLRRDNGTATAAALPEETSANVTAAIPFIAIGQ